MPLPGVTISIKDGALGRLAQGATNAFGLIGGSDKTATYNKITVVTDERQIASFGAGTLSEALTRAFELGASIVYAVALPANADNAGHLAAVDLLLAHPDLKEFIAIATPTEKTLWAAFDTKLEAAAAAHNYTFGVVQARAATATETAAAYETALSSAAERGTVRSKRLQICAGSHTFINSAGAEVTQNLITTYLGALQNRLPHHGPDAVKYGALPGVTAISPAFNDTQTLRLQDAGYTVLRHYYGIPGYFINLARLATDVTSDFDTVETIRVINKVSRQVRRQQLAYVNANIALDGSPEGLLQFKQQSELPLKNMITAGEISDAEVIIPDGQDIIGTKTVRVKVRIKPLGKLQTIETELSYTKETANGLA